VVQVVQRCDGSEEVLFFRSLARPTRRRKQAWRL